MGVQHRAERGPFEIADIGVPAAAEILRLVRLLADFEDVLVVRRGLDEIVDLQLAEAPAEARCCSGVMCWSRKKITWWSSKAWRISPIAASSTGASTNRAPTARRRARPAIRFTAIVRYAIAALRRGICHQGRMSSAEFPALAL